MFISKFKFSFQHAYSFKGTVHPEMKIVIIYSYFLLTFDCFCLKKINFVPHWFSSYGKKRTQNLLYSVEERKS